jgi:hypothetical protein
MDIHQMLALVLIPFERTKLIHSQCRVQKHPQDGIVSPWPLIRPGLDVDELFSRRNKPSHLDGL